MEAKRLRYFSYPVISLNRFFRMLLDTEAKKNFTPYELSVLIEASDIIANKLQNGN